MAGPNTPTSQTLALTTSALTTPVAVPAGAKSVTVWNRTGSALEAWITLDGSVPTSAVANSFYIPPALGAPTVIPIWRPPGAEQQPTVALNAIGSASGNLWLQFN